jgi:acyl carrier protein
VGIFSRKKKANDSTARTLRTSTNHGTLLKTKAEIIVEFTQENFHDEDFSEFFDYNDLGVPLAIAITQDMVDLTDSGLEIFEETWSDLCEIYDANPEESYEQLADLSGDDYEMIIPLEGAALDFSNQVLKDANWTPIPFDNESPISYDEAEDGVLSLILEVTGEFLSEDLLDSRFVEDIGIDSMSLVEITLAAEDWFNISISNEEAQSIQTARQAANLVFQKRANQ